MTKTPRLQRGDDGATAVLTAVLAVVLFGMAALAVEITDMYSRDRASQTVADLAALSGAQGLPSACAAFDRAADTLNSSSNDVRDDAQVSPLPGYNASIPDLRDGDVTNGEIYVLRDFATGDTPPFAAADVVPVTACDGTQVTATSDTDSGDGRFVKVYTPASTVDFAFASVLTNAPDSGSVQATATVGLRSPTLGDTLPVFLPVDCLFGANYVITNPASPAAGGPKPTFKPPGAAAADAPQIESVTASRLPGGLQRTLTIQVSNLTTPPTLSSVVFDLHAGKGAGTVRVPAVETDALTPVSLLAASPGPAPYTADYTLVVDAATVTDTAGEWYVRAKEPTKVDPADPALTIEGGWTNNNQTEFFTVAATSVGGCADPVYGNFGTVKGDRDDTSKDLPENLVQGLQFTVSAFPRTLLLDTPCQSDGTPADALLSNGAAPVPNCLEIDPGKSTGPIDQGLVDGVEGGGSEGRLVTAGSPTVPSGCVEPAGPGDLVANDHTWTYKTKKLVNTSLSCYTNGVDVVDLADPTVCDGCIDPAIIADPRYFLVPVLNTNGRPEVSNQYPVKEFRAAFITDETETADAQCLSAVDCNGLRFNATGKGQLFSVQAFVFPLTALPDEVPISGDGSVFTGAGPKDFLLVE